MPAALQAEASLATNAAALKELEAKLASAPDAGALEKDRVKLQAGAGVCRGCALRAALSGARLQRLLTDGQG